ncbi:glycosyl transferase [Endogone sp. FLAS-F59071]|nr:glycosyl transferase [Endogone sp. FLAS-F59071]|eukprot:RUS19209.1 glycosyl transferase [Endogone sp. FLAS-F59071]
MAADSSNPQIKSIIKTLVFQPDAFTSEQAYQAIHEIMSGVATEAQIAAFLMACRLTRKDAKPEVVVACERAIQEHALNTRFENAVLADEIVDRTGGDGQNTFNVSTTAAIVAAGGVKIAKIKSIIKTLVFQPDAFTSEQAYQAIYEIMSGVATEAQIAAFLMACRLTRKDAEPEVVVACGRAMQEHALNIHFKDALADEIVDIVGTGGDGQNTFNVSTTAAIVAAGAGVKIAKHGNRAASSSSGSADFLESYGCALINVAPEMVPDILVKHNFCFLFAQKYHPAMKNAAGLRREIGIPTIFNILGPLTNPAKPRRIIVGVHSRNLGELMIEALKLSGVKKAMVVCGAEGLDEISTAGYTYKHSSKIDVGNMTRIAAPLHYTMHRKTFSSDNYHRLLFHYQTWTLSDSGVITASTVHPTHDFGLATHELDSVRGGTPAENVRTLERILAGNLLVDDPVLDFVLLNAAGVLFVAGKAATFKEGVALAKNAIVLGKAKKALDGFMWATRTQDKS